MQSHPRMHVIRSLTSFRPQEIELHDQGGIHPPWTRSMRHSLDRLSAENGQQYEQRTMEIAGKFVKGWMHRRQSMQSTLELWVELKYNTLCLGIAVVFGIMRVPSDLSYIFHKRSGHTRSDRLAIGASQVVESGVTFFCRSRDCHTSCCRGERYVVGVSLSFYMFACLGFSRF